MGLRKLMAGLSRNTGLSWARLRSRRDQPSGSYNKLNESTDDERKTIATNTPIAMVEGSGRNLKIMSLLGLFLISLITMANFLRSFKGADTPQCQPIYMYPAYARIDGFDTRYTPLAKKYHLYLYREQDQDKEPLDENALQLDGVPVLFIPGNAGSFRQVRSIASACSNLYYRSFENIKNKQTRNLDFFTADFNEDFTAFHGGTMLDQAEYLNDAISYILSLYEQSTAYGSRTLPKSVIIVSHSMGGMVARVMPTLENHIAGSINSILTLSTPHAASPVTFDGDILKIYKKTNDYWRGQFGNKESFFSKNVSLISITGGVSDNVLPADYAAVADLIPPGNGFTTFTTTIPGVWSPIDHLAIVWCNQLRVVLATLLLESVDDHLAEKTKPLLERMHLSKSLLLSGFEDYSMDINTIANPRKSFRNMDTDFSSGVDIIEPDQLLLINKENQGDTGKFIKILIPPTGEQMSFTLVTSLDSPSVRFCKEYVQTQNVKDLKCISADEQMVTVPNSSNLVSYAADSSIDSKLKPFHLLNFEEDVLSQYDFIIIEKDMKAFEQENTFLTAVVSTTRDEKIAHVSPWKLAVSDIKFKLKSDIVAIETLRFSNLWDSLIAYKLETVISSSSGPDPFIFEPFIRQWVVEPFESKWHMNIEESKIDVTFHNIAPFIPLNETLRRPLEFSVIIPPNIELELKVKINWTLTLKMLFIRYRLGIASLPICFIALTLAYQFYYFNKTSTFISFDAAVSLLLQNWGPAAMIILYLLSPMINNTFVERILYILDPVKLNRPFLLEKEKVHTNFYFLGIRSCFSAVLGPLFGLMSVSLVSLLYLGLQLVELLVKKVSRKQVSRLVTSSQDEITDPSKINRKLFQKKHLIIALFLNVAVIFYIPYQLAFVIAVLMQIGTCVRIAFVKNIDNSRYYSNLRNYNLSILVLLLMVMTINIPIIIVFLHNVSIKWETSFRSHHNFLAIAPIIILVASNANFNMPTRIPNNSVDSLITIGLLSYMGFFSLVYGLRNLYWVHHLLNILCAWFFYGILRKKISSN
ncbi:hypothetical protein NCAS_0C03850 [Naumovozyma castellii]|uniref:GPI inositol-deacylase n=1 Tax=Naumovozyma castellii TaxID=27288 RepID=G0VD14_NAUCA|nr:hypothetical protein NCAS_0C03850 [Naumovozyma castellii CBS 4309]CCC69375.1 hypothetical protein NCAS_0C03850 [Naumovozyma castellii CBS 4309]